LRSITVIGSINMDLVVDAGRLPAAGETVLGGEFRVCPGGKGANQAVAAARLGAPVRFIGCVGRDAVGDQALENLRAAGIDVRGVRRVREHTGVALIVVDRQGRNLITVAPGANARTQTRRRCDIALMQLETPFAPPPARTLILNPAPAPTERLSLRGVDILIPNESEAERMTGQRDPAKAAAALRRMGAGRVIITLGARGVWDEGVRPAPRVDVVDTVGAGDAFVGAFAAALARGDEDPVAIGQAAAALACTRKGAQSAPRRRELDALLAQSNPRRVAARPRRARR